MSLSVQEQHGDIPSVLPMTNPIRDYAWGSATTLAEMQGREPHGGPEAELWMGTHPSAPSSVLVDGQAVPLPDLLAQVGSPPLTFLMKIMAIQEPLSIQVHPSAARARQRYGQPDSPYVDDAHKPEMLLALSESEALFGFRPAAEVERLLEPIVRGSALASLTVDLAEDGRGEPERLRRVLERLVTWPVEDRPARVAEVIAAVEERDVSSGDLTAAAYRWILRLGQLYPADLMVLAPVVLDLRMLAPGDSIFVPAGVLHAYLSGLGVEIMAASDNVLRAGLTPKQVAVDELLTVVATRPDAAPVAETSEPRPGVTVWRVPVPDFQLTRAVVSGASSLPALPGAQIVLCTSGEVSVAAAGAEVSLTCATSAFVVPGSGPLTLQGEGVVFCASAGTS